MSKLLNLLTLVLLIYSCKTVDYSSKPQNTIPKKIQKTYTLKTFDGIELEIEMQYAFDITSSRSCTAEFIVTNKAKRPYTSNEDIIFEFTMNDGKIFEQDTHFWEDLQPNRTASSRSVNISKGVGRHCIGVKPVRIESRNKKPITEIKESKSYNIKSEKGHTFKVDLSFNENCSVTYILTNTGNKDLIYDGLGSSSKDMYVPILVFGISDDEGNQYEDAVQLQQTSNQLKTGLSSKPKDYQFKNDNKLVCVSIIPLRVENYIKDKK